MLDLEQLKSINLTAGAGDGPRTVTFLPEPEPAERPYTVISVDDHVVEPAASLRGPGAGASPIGRPTWSSEDDGREVWHYEGTRARTSG